MKDIIEEYLKEYKKDAEIEKKEKLIPILLDDTEYNLTLFHITDDEWHVSLYNKSNGEVCSFISIEGYENALKYFNDLVKKYGGSLIGNKEI